MTDIFTYDKLHEMRERYTPKPLPTCCICGAELRQGLFSQGRSEYHCSSEAAQPIRYKWGSPEEEKAREHWARSTVIRTAYDAGDPDVIALLDELAKARIQVEAAP